MKCLRSLTGVSSKMKRTKDKWLEVDKELAKGLIGRLYRDYSHLFEVPDHEIYVLGILVDFNITPRIAGIISAVYGCDVLNLIMNEHILRHHK